MLVPPCGGSSNEYPLSLFWIRNKKCTPKFHYIKAGCKRVFISPTCFPGLEVIKKFSCSTPLSLKFKLLMNFILK